MKLSCQGRGIYLERAGKGWNQTKNITQYMEFSKN